MENKKQFIRGIAVGVVVTALVAGGAFFGSRALTKVSDDRKTESGQLNLTSSEVEEKLTEIEALVQKYYLNEIDTEKVENYLYKGMIAGLDDAYAAYYTEEEYKSMIDSTNGSYFGIGVEMSQNMTTGIITITRVFEGSPAEEVGLLPGDLIYKVQDTEVTGEDLTKVVSMVKGAEGTTVPISVAREGESDYLTFDVERRTIEIATVEHRMLDGNIGYIRVHYFEGNLDTQFQNTVEEFQKTGVKGLVIDLRDNGGGYVDLATAVADIFIDDDVIFSSKDKYGRKLAYYADPGAWDIPVVLILNKYSASASEILAGAIRDNHAGLLVGTKTFGKGVVQSSLEFADGSGMKVTTARYYTPSGECIHEIGIEPDVEVELDEDAVTRYGINNLPHDHDAQLQKAIELLGGTPVLTTATPDEADAAEEK